MSDLILYLGGARSGKSRLAEQRLAALQKVVYIATAEAGDDEMKQRIAHHRQTRPAHWITVEEPLNLPAALGLALAHKPHAILLDCLTLWLSNQLLRQWEKGWTPDAEAAVLKALDETAGLFIHSPVQQIIVISNEVGSGVVPDNAMARAFRDLSGRANQRMAQHAREVYLVTAGLSSRLK